ncbi:hypothetical protein [Duganella sp. CF517]|uniref:hypothetical protein n=1 Tax=Duganella sp. CF517 TaxID=1881038 RepID=UPI0011607811|nr:hypothetical protein [Duganella sp. CF517]
MTKIINVLGLVISAICVAGCNTMSEVRLYDGPAQNQSQIAGLYLDPHVMVTDVDNVHSHPTDKSRVLAHSAGKRREYISLAPGPHKLNAGFFVLCLRTEKVYPLEFNAEAGKKYRLKPNVDATLKKWQPEIVEFDGTEVENDFPWLKAMCPPNVTVVRLGR